MNESTFNSSQQRSKRPLSIEVFDGHSFERFTITDKNTGTLYNSYAVDGFEVNEKSWDEQRQRALVKDMVSLNINPR